MAVLEKNLEIELYIPLSATFYCITGNLCLRQGLRGEKAAMAGKYKVKEDVKKSPSSLSRPLTSVSMVQSSDDNLSQGNEVQG